MARKQEMPARLLELLVRPGSSGFTESRPIQVCVFVTETTKDNLLRHLMLFEPLQGCAHGNVTGLVFRIAVSARCDARKRDCLGAALACKLERGMIARCQYRLLAVLAVFPNRTH